MRESEAYITEVFSSIQGEGLTCGERQVFVRFSTCNLKCGFCDTVGARSRRAKCMVERTSGRGDMKAEANPVSAKRLVEIARRLDAPPGAHHSISLTGGEPLLQAAFLEKFLELNRADGLRTQLETNGTLPEELERVIDKVDFVSMDIKLQSASGAETPWEAHEKFLTIARRKPVWVKVVVAAKTTVEEIRKAAALVAEVDRGIPMVIQPVTPVRKTRAPSGARLMAFQEAARGYLHTVKVIPQMHKVLGIR